MAPRRPINSRGPPASESLRRGLKPMLLHQVLGMGATIVLGACFVRLHGLVKQYIQSLKGRLELHFCQFKQRTIVIEQSTERTLAHDRALIRNRGEFGLEDLVSEGLMVAFVAATTIDSLWTSNPMYRTFFMAARLLAFDWCLPRARITPAPLNLWLGRHTSATHA
jgi:hypothetical protein